jgi:glycosyltransferase involved in cell wall biosynthesis
MKVFFDHEIFTAQDYGGISRYFASLQHIFKESQKADLEIAVPNWRTNNLHYCNVYGTKPTGYTFRKLTEGYNDIINCKAQIFGDFDLIHRTYMQATFNPKHVPEICTIHDCIPERFPDEFNLQDFVQVKNNLMQRCARIIAVSNQTKEDLLTYYDIAESKIDVVHHCVPSFPTDNEINVPLPKRFILFVGKRRGYKNFRGLLGAFEAAKLEKMGYKIVAFGGGAKTMEDLYEIEACQLNGDNVIFMNGDDRLLADLYRNAACFVFPSLYEGFGIPLLEAFSENCVVCCSNISVFHEIASDEAEYFDPLSKGDFSSALLRCITKDKPNVSDMIFNKFSSSKIYSETLSTYIKALQA